MTLPTRIFGGVIYVVLVLIFVLLFLAAPQSQRAPSIFVAVLLMGLVAPRGEGLQSLALEFLLAAVWMIMEILPVFGLGTINAACVSILMLPTLYYSLGDIRSAHKFPWYALLVIMVSVLVSAILYLTPFLFATPVQRDLILDIARCLDTGCATTSQRYNVYVLEGIPASFISIVLVVITVWLCRVAIYRLKVSQQRQRTSS